MVSITSFRDIVANTLSVIDQDKVIDLKNMFDQNQMRLITFQDYHLKHETLFKLAEAIHSDASVRYEYERRINSTITYVNTQFDIIIMKCLNYDTRDESTIKFLPSSSKVNTSNKSEVSILETLV